MSPGISRPLGRRGCQAVNFGRADGNIPELEWELSQRDLDRPDEAMDIESTAYITLDSAKAYCAEKKNFWRLPSVEELYELDRQKSEYLDRGDFWSSYPVGASHFVVRDGQKLHRKEYKARVRCVREIKN